MPRYLIERTFPNGLRVPMDDVGSRALTGIVGQNAAEGVTWVHSYVTPDGPRPTASMTGLTRRRSDARPPATPFRSSGSAKYACSTRTSTPRAHEGPTVGGSVDVRPGDSRLRGRP